jgi:hypothetical protein
MKFRYRVKLPKRSSLKSIIAVGVYEGSIIIKDAWDAANDNGELNYQILTLHITLDFSIYLPVLFRRMGYQNKALVDIDDNKRQIVIFDKR